MMIKAFSSLVLLSLAALAVGLWAGNSAQRPQRDSGLLEPCLQSFSRGQLLVGNATASRCEDETIEPLQGVELHVAEIQPECKFVNVASEMLLTGVMIHASQSAFEDCPDALYRVRVSHSTAVLTRRMVYRLVGEEKTADAAVSLKFVGAENGANGDVVVNGLLNRRQIGRGNGHRLSSTAALTHTENRSLTDRAATEHHSLIGVFRGFLTADVGFVYLDNALQLVDVVPAGFAEPLEHKPRRFLRNAYLFAQLERRDAFAGRNKQIHRIDPFVERNVRPLEDRSRSHGEIQHTGVTAIEAVLSDSDSLTAFTGRTKNAVRPQSGFQIEPRGFLVWDQFKQLKGRYGAFAHRPNLAKWS